MQDPDFVLTKRIVTPRSFDSIPRLMHIGEEIRSHPSYSYQGKYRTGENHCVFQYTLSGGGVYYDKRGKYAVNAGSGFFSWTSDPETGYYYPEDVTEPWHFLYFNFMGKNLADFVHDLTERAGPVFRLPKNNPAIKALLRIFHSPSSDLPFSEAVAVTSLLFNEFIRIADAPERSGREQELVYAAKNHIQQYITHSLNAAEVARTLNVSREHLTRVFSKETGQTLYQYILREKIIRACQMLKETRLSSKEISSELGFDQPSHFNRAFQRLLQMTPKRFREVGAPPIFPI